MLPRDAISRILYEPVCRRLSRVAQGREGEIWRMTLTLTHPSQEGRTLPVHAQTRPDQTSSASQCQHECQQLEAEHQSHRSAAPSCAGEATKSRSMPTVKVVDPHGETTEPVQAAISTLAKLHAITTKTVTVIPRKNCGIWHCP